MLDLSEPYAPRPIRSLGQWAIAGMRLKIHGIAYQLAQPRVEVIDAAHDLVRRELPQLNAGQNHYGVGFVGVHDGRGAIFVFLDFWTDENELRHMLAQFGRTRYFRGFLRGDSYGVLGEVVRAAESLGKRRHGALIVIERETSLKDFIEVGTPLDAKVSRELLASIFHPTSPIHDGAVIIRNLRIFQAGVLLEVVKDLLYQAYVRRGRLQQAMMVRRYFAEDASSKVTPLPGARS